MKRCLKATIGAAGWDGDAYRLLEGAGGEVLVWVSAWDSETDATEFERAAAAAQEARYEGQSDRETDVLRLVRSGVPLVVLVDRPAGMEAAQIEPLFELSVTPAR